MGLVFVGMMILSASGGGWIATAVGLAVVFVGWRKKSALVVVPLAAVAAGAAALFYGQTLWLQETFATGSLLARFKMWQHTLGLLSGRGLAVGLGLGGWRTVYSERLGESQVHVHNAYLQLYTDTGVLGIVALVLAAMVFVRLSRGMLSSPRGQAWYGVGAGMTAAIVAGAVMAMYDVTTTVTVVGAASYVYLSVPLLWVWVALLVVAHERLATGMPGASPRYHVRRVTAIPRTPLET
jgi:O-antigen ligase